jgi:hypothetical protein
LPGKDACAQEQNRVLHDEHEIQREQYRHNERCEKGAPIHSVAPLTQLWR